MQQLDRAQTKFGLGKMEHGSIVVFLRLVQVRFLVICRQICSLLQRYLWIPAMTWMLTSVNAHSPTPPHQALKPYAHRTWQHRP